MGLEKIGLEGVFKTDAFAAGLSKYTSGLSSAGNATLGAAGSIASAIGGAVVTAGAAFIALGTAAVVASGVVAGAISKMVFDAATMADSFAKMAAVTGLSTTRLQELKYAGTMLDVDLETITSGLRFLTRNMYAAREGTGEQAEAFEALGIKVLDAKGNLRDADTVFGEAIDALGKMKNPTVADAIAMKLMGRSAMELNPLIKAGSAALAKYSAEAHAMGAVVSEEGIEALDKFRDMVDAGKLSLKAISATVATAFLPAFQAVADLFQKVLSDPKTQEWLKTLTDSVGSFVQILLGGGGLTEALAGLQPLFANLPTIGEMLSSIFDTGVDLSGKFRAWVDGVDWSELSKDVAAAISAQPWSDWGAAAGKIVNNLFGAIKDMVIGKQVVAYNGSQLEVKTVGGIDWSALTKSIGKGFANAVVGVLTLEENATFRTEILDVFAADSKLLQQMIDQYGEKNVLKAFWKIEIVPLLKFTLTGGSLQAGFQKQIQDELQNTTPLNLADIAIKLINKWWSIGTTQNMSGLKTWFSGLRNPFEGLGSLILDAIGKSLTNMANLDQWAKDTVKKILGALQIAFTNPIPSSVDGVGFGWGAGIGTGLINSIFSPDVMAAAGTAAANLVNSISLGFQTGWTIFTGWLQGVVDSIFGGGKEGGLLFVNALVAMQTAGANLITVLQTGAIPAWDTLSAWFTGVVNGLFGDGKDSNNPLLAMVGDMTQVGADVINGLWGGLQSAWVGVENWWNSVVLEFIQNAKDILMANSESDVFFGVGQDVVKGFASGIKKGMNLPVNALAEVMRSLTTDINPYVSFGQVAPASTAVSTHSENFAFYAPVYFQGAQTPGSLGAAIKGRRY